MQFLGPWVPNFKHFCSTFCRFQDFLVDPHVKISKCHKIFDIFFNRSLKIFITLYSPFYHKFWLRSDKNYRRSSILKSPLPYGPVLLKKSKYHKFCFCHIAKNYSFTFLHDYNWLRLDKNCRRSSALNWIFGLPWVRNEKHNRKNFENWKNL